MTEAGGDGSECKGNQRGCVDRNIVVIYLISIAERLSLDIDTAYVTKDAVGALKCECKQRCRLDYYSAIRLDSVAIFSILTVPYVTVTSPRTHMRPTIPLLDTRLQSVETIVM